MKLGTGSGSRFEVQYSAILSSVSLLWPLRPGGPNNTTVYYCTDCCLVPPGRRGHTVLGHLVEAYRLTTVKTLVYDL